MRLIKKKLKAFFNHKQQLNKTLQQTLFRGAGLCMGMV